MIEVTLNETEIKMARDLAFSRAIQNRQTNVTDISYAKKPGIFLDYQGTSGEIAYCSLMNLYPDTRFNYPPGRRPKADCITPAGCRIDVKTHQNMNSPLKVTTTKKPDDVDVYALVLGTSPKLFVYGTIAAAKVFQDCYRKTKDGRTWFEVPQSKIRPIEHSIEKAKNHDRSQQIPTGVTANTHPNDGEDSRAMPG